MQKLKSLIHPFHLVDPSPWPFIGGISVMSATVGGVLWFNLYSGGGGLLFFGLVLVVVVMITWWRDIIRENTYEGNQSLQVENGLRMGMLLFITSEIMFFFAFFWGFFYSSINPEF